jgi:glycosyltransferase involved in cell wall biosynthesis
MGLVFSIMRKTVSIIIPAKDEEKHIQFLIKTVSQLYDDINIIVINDGSTDNTAIIAQKHTPHVLSHSINLGKGAALKTGCEYAFNYLNADYVIMMDADEQHAPSDISKFLEKINERHEIILGVRSFKGMPLVPTYSNMLISFIFLVFFRRYIPDIPSGFKAISKNAYKHIFWKSAGYEVEMEIAQKIAQKKLEFTTVPIKTIYPEYVRGMTPLDGIKAIFKLFGLR